MANRSLKSLFTGIVVSLHRQRVEDHVPEIENPLLWRHCTPKLAIESVLVRTHADQLAGHNPAIRTLTFGHAVIVVAGPELSIAAAATKSKAPTNPGGPRCAGDNF